MNEKDLSRLAQFLFEVGTVRKTARMHRQALLTDDMSDNIATHSFRVAIIASIIAKAEGESPYLAMLMGLLHDLDEARSNDHNWIHKRYVTIDKGQILEEQFGTLPVKFDFLFDAISEYEKRESHVSICVKDADLLDQILLLREYAWQGNEEAKLWLEGKSHKRPYAYVDLLQTDSGKALGRAIYDEDPSSWWKNLYTSENRE